MPKFKVGDSLFRIRSGTIKKFDETHTRWVPDFVLQPVTIVKKPELEKYSIPLYAARTPHGVIMLYEIELLTKEEAFMKRLKGMKLA